MRLPSSVDLPHHSSSSRPLAWSSATADVLQVFRGNLLRISLSILISGKLLRTNRFFGGKLFRTNGLFRGELLRASVLTNVKLLRTNGLFRDKLLSPLISGNLVGTNGLIRV
jgi:hypothetical protein